MNEDARDDSLAARAAAWVPPWEREKPPTVRDPEPPEPTESPEPTEPPEPTESPEATEASEPAGATSERPAGSDPAAAEIPTSDGALGGVPTSDADLDDAPTSDAAQPAALPEPSAEGSAEPADAAVEVVEAGGGAEPGVEGSAEWVDGLTGGDDAEVVGRESSGEPVDALVGGDELGGAVGGGGVAEEREETRTAEEDVLFGVAEAAGGAAPPVRLMPSDELRAALEAILLVVDEPVAESLLAQVLEQPVARVTNALADLADQYGEQRRGFDLRRAAGGWRLYTRPEFAPYVERFVLDGQSVRLTQAALETLAVVAYKQPVTRSRISAIRGVNCDGVVRTLVTRGLIEEAGTEPETGAHLYRTSSLFLEKLGLDSVDQLPPLAPFLPDNVDEIDAER